MSETPYAETEALLAILNEDEEHAIELLAEMTRFERAEFLASVLTLRDLLNEKAWCIGCEGFISRDQNQLGPMWPIVWHKECWEAHERAKTHAAETVGHAARRNPQWGQS